MATEILETERKYEALPGVPMPPLDGLPQVAEVSEPEVETLVAEYYDANDLRLLKAGATLRRREGGADAGWHLKLPGETKNEPGTARREFRVPAGQPGHPVPDELTRLVRVHTRGAALRPVARVETRRLKHTLRDTAGTSLAEVVSDEVAAQSFGDSTTLSHWSEIEVELTGGGPGLLRAADKQLRDSGLRPAGYSAKLARALAADLPRSRAGHQLTEFRRRQQHVPRPDRHPAVDQRHRQRAEFVGQRRSGVRQPAQRRVQRGPPARRTVHSGHRRRQVGRL